LIGCILADVPVPWIFSVIISNGRNVGGILLQKQGCFRQVCPAFGSNIRNRVLYVGHRPERGIGLKQLVEALFYDGMRPVKLGGIGIQLALGPFLDGNFGISLCGNRTAGCTKRMADVRDNVLLVCLVAVYLQAELSQPCLGQLAVHYIQGCQLFRNEEDLFAVIEAFCNYGDYFNGHEDDNAICYLTLANILIHEVKKDAVTIAEEVSGMPGLAAKFEDGGYGFDYRMAMNVPDFWIKTIKELPDENWKPSSILWEVTNRRSDERTISYCESHDQALVGDKTIIFRLVDSDMYWHFKCGDENDRANRGIALHKMIRLVTASTINGGYLNFMGNEFGHPEWIDFPREGNGWSHKYARRQWNLVDNPELDYHFLGDFDKAMLDVLKSVKGIQNLPVQEIWHNDSDQILAYMRGDLVFVFNFSPSRSFTDYGFLVPTGSYDVVLNTDAKAFGGNGLADDSITHLTNYDPAYVGEHKEWLKLYVPARSAVVLKKN